MFNHFTARDGRSIRYYICPTANAGGPKKCERARVPAGQIVQFVIERITFDGKAGEIEIKFRSGGVKVMAKETSA